MNRDTTVMYDRMCCTCFNRLDLVILWDSKVSKIRKRTYNSTTIRWDDIQLNNWCLQVQQVVSWALSSEQLILPTLLNVECEFQDQITDNNNHHHRYQAQTFIIYVQVDTKNRARYHRSLFTVKYAKYITISWVLVVNTFACPSKALGSPSVKGGSL